MKDILLLSIARIRKGKNILALSIWLRPTQFWIGISYSSLLGKKAVDIQLLPFLSIYFMAIPFNLIQDLYPDLWIKKPVPD